MANDSVFRQPSLLEMWILFRLWSRPAPIGSAHGAQKSPSKPAFCRITYLLANVQAHFQTPFWRFLNVRLVLSKLYNPPSLHSPAQFLHTRMFCPPSLRRPSTLVWPFCCTVGRTRLSPLLYTNSSRCLFNFSVDSTLLIFLSPVPPAVMNQRYWFRGALI